MPVPLHEAVYSWSSPLMTTLSNKHPSVDATRTTPQTTG